MATAAEISRSTTLLQRQIAEADTIGSAGWDINSMASPIMRSRWLKKQENYHDS